MKRRPMKASRLNLFLVTLAAMAVLAIGFPQAALANTAAASVDGKTFNTYAEAWAYAAINGGRTIEALSDWDTTAHLVVPEGVEITVNLNGHIINRHLANSDNVDSSITGEVFCVEDSGTLNVNGGDDSTVHNGRILSNGIWYADADGQTSIKGGAIAGGYDADASGGIQMKASATVNLNNVTLCGNMSALTPYLSNSGRGGAINIGGEKSKLNLVNTRIEYNRASQAGGGIYIASNRCTVRLDSDSSVEKNTTSGNGGGIFSSGENVDITGGTVSGNTGKNGGGIYVAGETTSIEDMTLSGNTSENYGGGVFIDAGGSVSLNNCTVSGNTAKQGGGVYDNGDGNSLGDCTITENHASENYGGGVYVSSIDDIGLSGIMIIKNNTATSDKHASDLHLGSKVTQAYISSMPDYRSSIGIYVTDLDSGDALSLEGAYTASSFFSDKSGWYVDWIDKASDGNRKLIWVKGTAPVSPSTKEVSPGATVTKETYNGSALLKGTFSYASVVNSIDDLDSVFYYSDGFFAKDPTEYDSHLATMSMNLAMSAFATNAGNDTGDYSNKFAHVKQLLCDIGCDDSKTYISTTYTQKPGTDTIGVAIAQKEIKVNDTEYTLVPIAVRGAGYESEWASNVTVGDGTDPASGEEAGFASAAEQVFSQVESYIKDDPDLLAKAKAGKVKFWVVGYSRAGATANLTSKRLIDGLQLSDGTESVVKTNQVYGYDFEAPQGGVASAEAGGSATYNCIHNLINKSDLVPLVAMSQMGFKRYGVDHYMPGGDVEGISESISDTDNNRCDNTSIAVNYHSSQYMQQRSLMLKQLAAINQTFTFDDYYHTATINYVGGGTGLTDMIVPLSAKGTGALSGNSIASAEEYESTFMRMLQFWSFGPLAVIKPGENFYRISYADTANSIGGADESLQTALQHIVALVYSKSPTEIAGIEAAASGITGNIGTGEALDLYWNVIRGWDDLSTSKKEEYLDSFWSYLMEPNGYSACVGDYLTYQEKQTLAKDWPVLGDFLFTLVSKDYDYDYNIEYSAKYGLTEGQMLIGTLAYNATSIMQGHYPEVNLAWLRSYDTFYSSDTTAVDVNTSEVTVASPTANLNSGYITGKDPLVLSSSNAGGAIYYRVRMQAEGHDDQGDWKLYSGSIPLSIYGSLETTYTVEAYAMEYGVKSDTVTYTYKIGKGILHIGVASNGDITKTAYTDSKPLIGDTVTLDPKTPTDAIFTGWTVRVLDDATKKWVDKTQEILGDQASNPYATFTMIKGEVEVTAHYGSKIGSISISLDTSTFDTGSAVLPATAEWACKGAIWYRSVGWPDDAASVDYEYSNGKLLPITWTKGAVADDKTFYTASMTFFPDPSQHFTKTDTDSLPTIFAFKSSGIAITLNGKSEAAISANSDGSVTISKTYQVKNPPTSQRVTVNCYDEYAQKYMDTEARNFEYASDSKVSLPAPSVQDEVFVGWTECDPYVTSNNASDTTIDFTMPASDIELTANYIPVVNELDLSVAAPVAGTALTTGITGCSVKITNTYQLDSKYFSLDWTPADKTAAYSTTYVATIGLSNEGKKTLGSKFVLADNAKVTMNGVAVSSDSISTDGDGNLVLAYAFPSTSDPNLVSVGSLAAVGGIENGTSIDSILSAKLPSAVSITTDTGASAAVVTWDSAKVKGYDPASTDQQTGMATGTITLPEGLGNTKGLSLEVTCQFTVEAKSYNLLGVTQPTVADQSNGISLDAIELPKTISISTDAGGPASAGVVWNLNNVSYDPSSTAEQTVVISGSLTLPEHVLATDESMTKVNLVFKVKAKVYQPITIDTATDAYALLKQKVTGSVYAQTGFTFTIEPIDSAPVPEQTSSSVTVSGKGTQAVGFGRLTLTQAGTFVYAVKQTSATPEKWKCDTSANYVTVVVAADGDTLKATVTSAVLVDTPPFKLSYAPDSDAHGSVTPAYEMVASGEKATGATAKAAEGYTFANWTSGDTEVGTDANLQPGTPEESKSYIANFKANAYTVKFNANDGSATPQTVDETGFSYGAPKNLTANAFTRNGYTFLGWSKSQTATKADYADGQSVTSLSAVNGDTVILYAVWVKLSDALISYNSADSAMGSCSLALERVAAGAVAGTAKGSTAQAAEGYHFDASVGWTLYGSKSTTPVSTKATITGEEVDKAARAHGLYTSVALVAHFAANTYTVSFDGNAPAGAAVVGSIDPIDMTYGASAKLTANRFTCEGHTFAGWSTDKNAVSAIYTDAQSVLNLAGKDKNGDAVTLYAVWTTNENVTLTYAPDDASHGTVSPVSESLPSGSSFKGSTAKANPGYHFMNWTLSGSETLVSADAAIKPGTATANTAYVAHFKGNPYTVRFNANAPSGATVEGSMSDETGFVYGTAKPLTANTLTCKGYVFAGWKVGDSSRYIADAAQVNDLTTGNPAAAKPPIVTLHAVWFALPEAAVSYSVAASADGAVHGSCNPAAESVGGTSVKPPSGSTAVPNMGYHFDASEGNGWTYKTVQGTEGTVSQSSGVSATLTSDDAAACCIVGTGASSYYIPCAFTAHMAANTYTVSFMGNAPMGSIVAGSTNQAGMTYDTKAPLTSNGFTCAGYSFTGWSTNADGSGTTYKDGEEVENLTADQGGEVKLFAQWSEKSATMSYLADDAGTVDVETDTIGAATGEPLPVTAQADAGYHFTNWTYANANGSGSAGSAAMLSVADIAAAAKATGIYVDTKFTAHFAANTYTVKFDANGGVGAPSDQTMAYGAETALTKAVGMAYAGYTFIGWSIDPAATAATYADGARVKDLTTVDGDIVTLHAVWNKDATGDSAGDSGKGGSSSSAGSSGSSVSGQGTSGGSVSASAAPNTSDSTAFELQTLLLVIGLAISLLAYAAARCRRARPR